MGDEEKIKIINPEELTSSERAGLINKTLVLSDDEKPDFKIEGKEEPAEKKFTQPFEITYVKPGEEPPAEGNEPPAGGEPPAEDKALKVKEEVYTKLAEVDPNFKEKYKSFDEWIAATDPSNEPPAGGEPPATGGEPTVILTPEQREDIILDKSYKFFSLNPTVRELLSKIGVTFEDGRTSPLTFEDWQNLHKADMEKNGSNFASSQILTIFNSTKANVTTQVDNIEKTAGDKNKLDGDAITEFTSTIEKTVKGLYPAITKKDAEPLVNKMKEFFKENGKKPEYNKVVNGISILNGKALITGFLAESVDLLGNIAKLSAKKAAPSMKEKLEAESKNGGKSIKTLGNQGHNSGSSKKGFLDNPKDREQLSSKERKKLLEAMDQEIVNL